MTRIRRKGVTSMRGRSGNACYSNSPYNKRDFIEKALPDRKSTVATEKQLKQQAIFRGYLDMEMALSDSIKVGFPLNGKHLQGRQLFKRENSKVRSITAVVNRTTVDGEEMVAIAYKVDYDLLVVASGSLKAPGVTCEGNAEQNTLTFTNKVPGVFGYECNATDKLYAVVCDTVENMSELVPLGTRGENTPVVHTLPDGFTTGNLQVYVFATLQNGKRASRSRHLALPA